jgi:signal transduction histidine kinase
MTSATTRSTRRVDSGLENSAAGDRIWRRVLLIVVYCALLSGCSSRQQSKDGNVIEFTRVPLIDKGGSPRLDTVQGRVIGARPGQQIVLFARSGAWYVQPFADQQFTKIQPDSTWSNSTHLGTEYAAVLVEPEYRPPAATYVLPGVGGGVVARAIVPGTPRFWQTWWFQFLCILAGAAAILLLYRLRLRQLTRQLNVRFEERLSERTRIAQDLHDTLLQGFLSASMQLHVAADQLPADSPAKPIVSRVLELMGQVIDEGRNAVRDLRSPGTGVHDLEQAFSRIQQELMLPEPVNFRVVVEGKSRPLHPIIRDEVYRIGREAVVNAFRHSGASSIEVDLEYSSKHLRIFVRDNGCGIDPQVLHSGRDGHWGLPGMRERAGEIGARLKVWSRAGGGTEVELSIPARTAFETHSSNGKREWLARLFPGRTVGGISGRGRDK